jgi:SAM-dependent methyltransferase
MSGNQEQQEYWDGVGGQRWTTHQEALDRMVRPFGLAAIERLALRPGEHVLDVGCGCGDTLLALAERVGERGSVTGVDLSTQMLARARERVPRATLIAGDVTELSFERRFDALFSRFGVMFFADPVGAFARLRGLLVGPPRGRVGFACWRAQAENGWGTVPFAAVRAALPELPLDPFARAEGPGPFAFADRNHVASVLRSAGFSHVEIAPFDAEVELSTTGLDEAARFSITAGPAARLLAQATPEQKARAAAFVADALAPYEKNGRVTLSGAAWTVLAKG